MKKYEDNQHIFCLRQHFFMKIWPKFGQNLPNFKKILLKNQKS